MPRRRRSRTVVSLFAFQDIITSVSGIIIVLVLLLTLELIDRPQAEGSPSSRAVADQIEQAIASAEQDLEALRETTGSTDELIREVANSPPAALRDQIGNLEQRIAQLQAQLALHREQAKQLEKAEEAAELQRFDLKETLESLDQARREVQTLETQLDEERRDNRLVYALPRGFEKEGWLALVEQHQIAVAPIGREAKPIFFTGTKLGPLTVSSAADRFIEWITGQGASSTYVLLLVRPGGVEDFQKIDQQLTDRGIAFGFDLVGADESVLHPVRGAAP